MTTKTPKGRHRATTRRTKRSAEEKARRQVLDDLDDLHEHVQGMEDTLADIAEIQRVTAEATVVLARALHGLIDYASREIVERAGGKRDEDVTAMLDELDAEIAKLEDVNQLMGHLEQYRDEVLKP